MRTDNEMLAALDKLCRVESVAEYGDERTPYGKGPAEALKTMLGICEGLGLRTVDRGGKIGYAEIGCGDELVGVLTHVDVVPATGEWRHPPYAATLDGGRIYGRGVTDDKGPAIACAFAMADILESGKKLTRRIRLILGQTEETGDWRDIEYYKANEELPVCGFTPDADFPATYGEKGIAILELTANADGAGFAELEGGHVPNMVADACSARLSDGTVLAETGVSAHGSTPEKGINAIAKLMEKAASRSSFAAFFMDKFGFETDGTSAGLAMTDKESGALSLNIGVVKLEDGLIRLKADVRYPVTFTLDEVISRLTAAVAPYGVSLAVLDAMKPVYMEKDGELICALMDVYRRQTGDDSQPTTMGGGTYARGMDNIVAFGPMLPGRPLTEHQRDEFMYYEDFALLRRIYREAMLKLAGGGAEIFA